ncbi:hypothetical protein BDF19DRAFT_428384 [Syncephalis fuscata]|nr:hypothetical protein BDF19DRAFT_428384 [Syncephalis fuscata]
MIYQFEGSYLQESAHGNIVRGFDQYLQSRPVGTTVTAGTRNRHSGAGVGGGTGAGTNNGRVTESERIFSHSSTTYRKAVGLADEEDYTSTTAISTRPSSPSSGDERPGAVLPSGVESSAVSRRSSSSTTASQQQRTHRPIAVSGDDMEDTAMHRANQEEDTTNRTLKRIRLSTHGRGPSNGGGGATNPESEGELDI